MNSGRDSGVYVPSWAVSALGTQPSPESISTAVRLSAFSSK